MITHQRARLQFNTDLLSGRDRKEQRTKPRVIVSLPFFPFWTTQITVITLQYMSSSLSPHIRILLSLSHSHAVIAQIILRYTICDIDDWRFRSVSRSFRIAILKQTTSCLHAQPQTREERAPKRNREKLRRRCVLVLTADLLGKPNSTILFIRRCASQPVTSEFSLRSFFFVVFSVRVLKLYFSFKGLTRIAHIWIKQPLRSILFGVFLLTIDRQRQIGSCWMKMNYSL